MVHDIEAQNYNLYSENAQIIRNKHLVESQYYNPKANSLGYRSQSKDMNQVSQYEI